MRYTYLKGKPIETLYFGGGTPSQLDEKDFRKYSTPSAGFMGWRIAMK